MRRCRTSSPVTSHGPGGVLDAAIATLCRSGKPSSENLAGIPATANGNGAGPDDVGGKPQLGAFLLSPQANRTRGCFRRGRCWATGSVSHPALDAAATVGAVLAACTSSAYQRGSARDSHKDLTAEMHRNCSRSFWRSFRPLTLFFRFDI